MVFNNSRGGFAPRQMVQGNWQCAGCGKEITELPFEPDPDRPIYCRDCWSQKRSRTRRGFGPRQMVQGNWQCAGCGKEITELPFEPPPDKPIYCKECWLKHRNKRFES